MLVNDIILILFFTCLSAGMAYMFDYGLGKPGSDEPSVTEFLSGWTFALARRRLMELDMYDAIEDAFTLKQNDPYQRMVIKKEFKKTVVDKAKDFFTWEKAVGMCMFCAGFWIAVIISIIFIFTTGLTILPDWFLFSIVPFSHFILRKI